MTVEIERAWRVDAPPPTQLAARATHVEQGYLSITDDAEVRVRRKGDEHLLTVKTGQGLQRGEVEVAISPEQFRTLWPATAGARIVKTRYDLEVEGHTAEVDVFEGELSGLVLVEVEFPSVEDAESFTPPEWFGHEVTALPGWNNAALALFGIPDTT